jgi:putative methionine-R-sulfoxide reductase with GAF domain
MSLASQAARSGALEAVERIINREPEADEILRASLAVLAERLPARFVAIAFVEGSELVLGPAAGTAPRAAARPPIAEPVQYQRTQVAELWIDSDAKPDAADRAFLRHVAALLSPYCLVGWDTGGEPWQP